MQRLIAVLLIFVFSCKTDSGHKGSSPFSNTNKKDGDSSVEDTGTSIDPSVASPDIVVHEDGESIVGISQEDIKAFQGPAGSDGATASADSAAPSSSDGASSSTDTSQATSTSPSRPKIDAKTAATVVGLIFAGAVVAAAAPVVAHDTYYFIQNSKHQGGMLFAFSQRFPDFYYWLGTYLNRKKVIAGEKNAIDLITGDMAALDPVQTTDFGGKPITIGSKMAPHKLSLIHGQPIRAGLPLYLSQLPDDELVRGDLNRLLAQRADGGVQVRGRPVVYLSEADFQSLGIVSVVEDRELEHLSEAISPDQVHQVSTPDNDDIPLDKLRRGAEAMERFALKGKGVLVHCKSGVGRSAEETAVFLMRNYGLTAEEAGLYVKKKRPWVRVGEQHIHQFAIEDYELAHLIADEETFLARAAHYNIDQRRLDKINEFRRKESVRTGNKKDFVVHVTAVADLQDRFVLRASSKVEFYERAQKFKVDKGRFEELKKKAPRKVAPELEFDDFKKFKPLKI